MSRNAPLTHLAERDASPDPSSTSSRSAGSQPPKRPLFSAARRRPLALQAEIFVLDDDEELLTDLKTALWRFGKVHANSLWSQLAVPLMRAKGEGTRSVLICNLNMLGINGLEFCRIVRKHSPETSIVILSNEDDDDTDALEREAGLADAVVRRGGVFAIARVVSTLVRH